VKFLCGSCRTKYQISDDKVRGKILTIRCKKCGAKILVRESLARDGAEGTVVAPVADEPAPAEPAAESSLSSAFNRALATHETHDIPVASSSQPPEVAYEWYTAIDGQQFGPFSFEQIQRQIHGGQLIGRHYVWHEGMDNWTRIRDVPSLREHLPSPTIPPPPPPPAESTSVRGAGAASFDEDAGSGTKALFSEDLTSAGAAARPLVVADGGGSEDDTESESEELPAEGEDLFASVPRASAAELVPKESTRFFVKAAGVGSTKSRNRLAIAFGATAVALFVGFVAAWASGIVRVELPGIGNPFVRGEGRTNLYDGESEDPNAVKGLLSGEGEEREPPERRRSRPRRRRAPAPAESGFEYVDAEEYESSLRSREDESMQGIEIGELGTGGGLERESVGDAELPSSNLDDIPAVDRGVLSPSDIQRTINSRKRSVKICYEQSLRGQDGLRGKLEIRVTIEPSGEVSDAVIETPAFKGSRIGKCIAEKIAEWRFPAFDGEPQAILVPFILERSAY